jgi:hypothetical protein
MVRYQLAEQLHFLAHDDTGREVVVTLQRWQSQNSRSAVYVRTHNGTETDRRVCRTDTDLNNLALSFTLAKDKFGDAMLSDDLAADEVSRRGGPTIRYCHVRDCGAQVPFAAGQCAEGHPTNQTPAGSYVMGSGRRPPFTVVTGGKS